MARVIKDNNPPWLKKKETSRKATGNKAFKAIFRIYCEGEVTEIQYFESFPINTTEWKVETIKGFGHQRTKLVETVIETLKKDQVLGLGLENKRFSQNYDKIRQIWVVFDFDIDYENGKNVAEDFNNAIALARKYGLQVAYSNDSFELWFVLHFIALQAKWTRKEYYAFLSEKFETDYEKVGKSKDFAATLYTLHKQNQEFAIKNAKRLLQANLSLPPSQQNPCTTVFQLVEELNKSLKP
ncbi:MAG: RloB family protein [Cytophagales bacterium]